MKPSISKTTTSSSGIRGGSSQGTKEKPSTSSSQNSTVTDKSVKTTDSKSIYPKIFNQIFRVRR